VLAEERPIGNLHNIILHARKTTLRPEFFQSKQKEANPDNKRLYHLVISGGIGWNSTLDMLERAFKLKDAIELYQMYFADDAEEPCADYVLTADDWLELSKLRELLAPIKECSLFVQNDYHGVASSKNNSNNLRRQPFWLRL